MTTLTVVRDIPEYGVLVCIDDNGAFYVLEIKASYNGQADSLRS